MNLREIPITPVWDLLRVSLCLEAGDSVTLAYDYAEIHTGLNLLEGRKIENLYHPWPELEVSSFDRTHICLEIKTGEDLRTLTCIPIPDTDEYDFEDIDEVKIRLRNSPVSLYVTDAAFRIIGTVEIGFMSFSYQIHEYDEIEECARPYLVDSQEWEKAANGDAQAAWTIADSIEKQYPEGLEIIAGYMNHAASLGNKDAQAWLADYYGDKDSKWDAWS